MASCTGAGETPAAIVVVFCAADAGAAKASPTVVAITTAAVFKTGNGLIPIQGIRLSFGKRAPLAPVHTLRDAACGVNVKMFTRLIFVA
jgi:hypothetical protein